MTTETEMERDGLRQRKKMLFLNLFAQIPSCSSQITYLCVSTLEELQCMGTEK